MDVWSVDSRPGPRLAIVPPAVGVEFVLALIGKRLLLALLAAFLVSGFVVAIKSALPLANQSKPHR